ncbi:MAG: hypothetical protein KJ949_03235 [Nanoarchaeota archaeon]|nr:hypothetical protein [Nanoarchaeota archaeon]
MEIEKEKQILYENLLSLTKETEGKDRYFSAPRILSYIKQKLNQEGISVGSQGRAFNDDENATWKFKSRKENDFFPRYNTLNSNLEALVNEGKIKKVIADQEERKYYRAII